MAARRRHKTRFKPTPSKPVLEITSVEPLETGETIAPGSNSFPENITTFEHGTTDLTSTDDDEYEISAPVRLPSRESLTRDLVPSDLIYQLEEYRSDERRMSAVFYIFIGGILGIIVNWITSESAAISKPSVIFLVVLFLIAIFFGYLMLDYKKRADKKIAEIKQAQVLSKPD